MNESDKTYDGIIYERVYVETPLDTDRDGKRDLICVWIKRPRATQNGLKTPAIYEASPYLMGTNEEVYEKLHNVDVDTVPVRPVPKSYQGARYVPREDTVPPPRVPAGFCENAFVPPFEFDSWYDQFLAHNYAVVFSGGIGTLYSEGIVMCGSAEETAAAAAVVDWLNGRARAFTDKHSNIEVKAYWCTGNVGMTGKSYRGTLCTAVAATGIDGLKAIVPVAAISSWYDYYRANGLVVSPFGWQGDDADLLSEYCLSRKLDKDDYALIKDLYAERLQQMREGMERETGLYNAFWDERNYINNAHKIKAGVFIVHGLNDFNVKPKQFDMLWKALERFNVPRKMILHCGEHINLYDTPGLNYFGIMKSWYDYWLHGIDNGVMDTLPAVLMQNAAKPELFEAQEGWPHPAAEYRTFYLENSGALAPNKSGGMTPEAFSGDLSVSGFDRNKPDDKKWLNEIAGRPELKRRDRLVFRTAPLKDDVRVSGTVYVTVNAAPDAQTGILSAMLTDYWETGFQSVTRGWLNPRSRTSACEAEEVEPGRFYSFKIDMQPTDYTFLKGHSIGVVIYGTDAEATERPLNVTNYSVNLDESRAEIPLM